MNENLENLVLELIKYPTELPWLEHKHNNYTRRQSARTLARWLTAQCSKTGMLRTSYGELMTPPIRLLVLNLIFRI